MKSPSILPQIFVASHDDARLRRVAAPLARRGSWIASFLLSELDRSVPCGSRDLPEDAVTMGCRVTYRVDDSDRVECGSLVYPEEYAPYRGHISVLTPEGAALLGLRPGSSMHYRTPSGRDRTIAVVRVDVPPPSNVLSFHPRTSWPPEFGPEPDGAA